MVWKRNLYTVAINTPEIVNILSKNGFPMETLAQEAAEMDELIERNQKEYYANNHQNDCCPTNVR